MTKLNYDRPQFRYLESLRRELTRQDRDAYNDKPSHVDMTGELPARALPLTEDEIAVAVQLLDAVDHHYLIEKTILDACRTRKGVLRSLNAAEEGARKNAERKMALAATAVAERMLQSGLEGRLNLVVLFSDLQQKIDPHLRVLIINDLMKSAFERLEARVRRIQ